MKELENLKESILKEYPRLSKDSIFKFGCNKNIACFNKCCSDVNIFLTPYDIIRLKKKLNITSQEFLDRYTNLPIDENLNYPIVMLRMNENESKTCPFVSPNGCSVYEDRPWSCRMFPLGIASPKNNGGFNNSEFYFILEEPVCMGYFEEKEWAVKDWMSNQQVEEYNKMGELFKEISLHDYFKNGKKLEPAKMEMFYTVCYNIDKFREFIFESSFLNRFELPEEILNTIKNNDTELLKFGFDWLKFCLFGEKTLEIKSKAAAN